MLVKHGGDRPIGSAELSQATRQDPATLEQHLSQLVDLGLVREHCLDGMPAWRATTQGAVIGRVV